jgi:hypothetical protein
MLLQPFAHGIANRSAGLAIDLFAVVGVAVHDGIPLGIQYWRTKSPQRKWFPGESGLHALLVKMA